MVRNRKQKNNFFRPIKIVAQLWLITYRHDSIDYQRNEKKIYFAKFIAGVFIIDIYIKTQTRKKFEIFSHYIFDE